MNKVLIIIGDASETMDTLYPVYRLQEDGFVPVIAALGVAGPAHVFALNAQGPLPTLDLAIGPRVHVGVDTA